MDPYTFLQEERSWERNLMFALAEAILQLEQQRDLDRAKMIAAEVSKLFRSN